MLQTLLDRSDGGAVPLGAELERRYGGALRFPTRRPWVFANFVESIDGVVSLGVSGAAHASVISARNPDDRFMLALLRVVADAVVVGAGTLRHEPKSVWTPDHVLPELAVEFAAVRTAMKLSDAPLTVLVTRSGKLDLSLPVFAAGHPVLILTTPEGLGRLGTLPAQVRARALDGGGGPKEIVEIVSAEAGGGLILTEGGPTLLGEFLRGGALDELFLTIAPRLAGRDEERPRLALVEKAAFEPGELREMRLVGVKSGEDYLFTRFARR